MKALIAVWIVAALIGCAGIYGWVWNIIKIVNTHFAVIDGMFIARCIGVIVAPLGAILGFF